LDCARAIFEVKWSESSINVLMVRNSLALLSGFAILGAFSSRADDVLPPRFNFDRYTRMLDHSPFAVATAVALPEAAPDFAKDLYVANAARSPEGDMATIMSSSDQNFKKYLNTKEPVDGYSIASIEWSEKVGETKVTISKDGKFATLPFNQALVLGAPPAGSHGAGQMASGVAMISASSAASRGRARGVIPRKTKPAPPPTAAFTPLPEPVPNAWAEPDNPVLPNLEVPQAIDPINPQVRPAQQQDIPGQVPGRQ
jgi:hypothetical protein